MIRDHVDFTVTAPQLKISDARMTVTGEKGYSMVRATHGMTLDSYDAATTFMNCCTRKCISQPIVQIQGCFILILTHIIGTGTLAIVPLTNAIGSGIRRG